MRTITAMRRKLAACTALALCVVAAACSAGESSSAGGSTGGGGITGPLVHAVPSDFNSLDPANTQGALDQEIVTNLYDKLLAPKMEEAEDGTLVWDGLEVEPWLAESWEDDGPVVTFHLRKDVTFHPTGNPFTAEDVRYSFERLTQITGNGQFQAGVAGIFRPEQIEVVDDHTVRITFTNPAGVPTAVPVRIASMRFLQFGIVDSVEVKKHATPDDPWAQKFLEENVASTGPYYVEAHRPNEEIRLRAVPDHFSGEQPPFEQVIMRVTGDADLVSLIRGGQVHLASQGLTGRQYDELERAGFPVHRGPTPAVLRLSMATDKPPFTDARVRQAVMHAIPYDEIIQVAFSGRGDRALTILNPQDPLSTDDWEAYDHDPAKAAELLKEAGQGPFSFDLWYSADISYNEDIALLMADSLKQIGVTANLQGRPALQLTDQYRARIRGQDQSMSGMYMSETTIWLDDPETHIDLWGKSTGTGNWARFNDPVVDRLHAEFRHSSDAAARADAYAEIQRRLFESAAINPVVVVGKTVAASPDLGGVSFTWDPYTWYRFLRPAD